ncbi:hypothetical protein OAU26_01625, partial [Mariniblastus sp.]|nr:hypothetical protein [Mariniblastus sp.]
SKITSLQRKTNSQIPRNPQHPPQLSNLKDAGFSFIGHVNRQVHGLNNLTVNFWMTFYLIPTQEVKAPFQL